MTIEQERTYEERNCQHDDHGACTHCYAVALASRDTLAAKLAEALRNIDEAALSSQLWAQRATTAEAKLAEVKRERDEAATAWANGSKQFQELHARLAKVTEALQEARRDALQEALALAERELACERRQNAGHKTQFSNGALAAFGNIVAKLTALAQPSPSSGAGSDATGSVAVGLALADLAAEECENGIEAIGETCSQIDPDQDEDARRFEHWCGPCIAKALLADGFSSSVTASGESAEVLAEREACAKVADAHAAHMRSIAYRKEAASASEIAAAIRFRGFK